MRGLEEEHLSYILFWGRHCVRADSDTQVIATSSAEAKSCGWGAGASVVVASCTTSAVPVWAPLLDMNATWGMGIASRRGLGPIKHLATPALWLQATVLRRELPLANVNAEPNAADGGTTALPCPALRQHMEAMRPRERLGRSCMGVRVPAAGGEGGDYLGGGRGVGRWLGPGRLGNRVWTHASPSSFACS